MGSYNVMCSLSRISIGAGDRILFIPAVKDHIIKRPGDDDFLHMPPTACLSTSGSWGLCPVTIPIRGTYDDYGDVSIDENQEHSQLVEDALGVSLESVVNYATDVHDHEEHNEILKKLFPEGLYGIFILEEVYDKAIRYMRKHNNFNKNGSLTDYALRDLGFKLKETLDRTVEARYHDVYIHPKVQKYAVLSDGDWVQFAKISKGSKSGYKHINAALYWPSQLTTLIEVVAGKHIGKFEWDETLAERMSLEKICFRMKERYEFKLKLAEEGATTKAAIRHVTAGTRFDVREIWHGHNTGVITSIYTPVMVRMEHDYLTRIAEYMALRSYMYSAGALFLPTMTGPQCGEHEVSCDLALTIAEITRRKITASFYD